jgi:hypothetical protein
VPFLAVLSAKVNKEKIFSEQVIEMLHACLALDFLVPPF